MITLSELAADERVAYIGEKDILQQLLFADKLKLSYESTTSVREFFYSVGGFQFKETLFNPANTSLFGRGHSHLKLDKADFNKSEEDLVAAIRTVMSEIYSRSVGFSCWEWGYSSLANRAFATVMKELGIKLLVQEDVEWDRLPQGPYQPLSKVVDFAKSNVSYERQRQTVFRPLTGQRVQLLTGQSLEGRLFLSTVGRFVSCGKSILDASRYGALYTDEMCHIDYFKYKDGIRLLSLAEYVITNKHMRFVLTNFPYEWVRALQDALREDEWIHAHFLEQDFSSGAVWAHVNNGDLKDERVVMALYSEGYNPTLAAVYNPDLLRAMNYVR